MKISVCLIVKNEEKVLERCLSCVVGFADEIVVVDTGSEDDTKRIARNFTDKIYDFKWNYDFAEARNYAFSLASYPYAFWIDADDVITKENVDKILELKRERNNADTYMMKYAVAFNDCGEPSFEFYRERLVRNCEYAKFKSFVHEAIIPFGIVKRCDITIEHRKISSGNPRRNIGLYERHLSAGENLDARGQYYYAKEFFYLKEYGSCEHELTKYLAMSGKFFPNEKDAYITLSICRKIMKKNDAKEPLFKALAIAGPDAEIFCRLGDIETDYKKGTEYYKCALCCEYPDENGGFLDKKFYYLEPLLRLVAISYENGDKTNAKFFHDLCVKNYPSSAAVIYNSQFFK